MKKNISGNRLVQIHLQTEELVYLPARLNSPVVCNVDPSFLNMFFKISNVNLIVVCVTNYIVTFACDWPFTSEAPCTGPYWAPLRTYKHFQTSGGGSCKMNLVSGETIPSIENAGRPGHLPEPGRGAYSTTQTL